MSEINNEVLVERLDNFKETVEKGFTGIHRRFDENAKEHQTLDSNQKYTNGKVRRIEIWKGTIVGAVAVVVFVSGYALKDYFEFKTAMFEYQKQNMVVNEKIKNLDSRIQSLEEIIIKVD